MSSIPTTVLNSSASSSSSNINLLDSHPSSVQPHNSTTYQPNNIFKTTVNMVSMKALVALLPFFLSMVAALPRDAAANNMTTPVSAAENNNVDLAAEGWGVNASDGSVNVNFYEDKNPDHSTIIDANTCEGKAEIALMKWRKDCKTAMALFRIKKCWNYAPSREACCPVPHQSSCTRYWPKPGE